MTRHFGGVNPGRKSDKTRALIFVSSFLVLVFSAVAFIVLSVSDSPATAPVASAPAVKEEDRARMLEVLVPIRQIEAGVPLAATMFRKESRPELSLPPRVLLNEEEVNGQYARTLILPGAPVTRDFLTSVKPVNILTAKIPKGFRAVSIRVDQRTSVEGFARPGSKVDVVWATTVKGEQAIVTIVENAEVLSAERDTNSKTNPGSPIPTTVTLMTSTEDAQKIQLAASSGGTMSLNLRGDSDTQGSDRGMTTVSDILDGPKSVNPEEDITGTITMGGIEYGILKSGKMVPRSHR